MPTNNFNQLLHDYLIAGDLLEELKDEPESPQYKSTAKVYGQLDIEISKYLNMMVKNIEGTLPPDEPEW